MILTLFGTETDYETMSRQITFLGKTIAEVKNQWQSLGTGGSNGKAGMLGSNLKSLFTSKPSAEFAVQLKKDKAALDDYNEALARAGGATIDMDKIFKNASASCRNYADRLNGAAADTAAFAKGQTQAVKGVTGLKNALTGLGAALASAAVVFAVSTVISKVVEGVTAVANASEEAQNKLEELNTAYEQTQGEVERLNSELETNKKLMDACKDTDTGVIVKQGEYDKLQATNLMLEAQLKLKQALAAEQAQEANEYANNILTGQQEKNGITQWFGKLFAANQYDTHKKVSDIENPSAFITSIEDDPLEAMKGEKEYIEALNKALEENARAYGAGEISAERYSSVYDTLNGKLEKTKENAREIAESIAQNPPIDDGSEIYRENAAIYQEIAQIYAEIAGVAAAADDTENKTIDKNTALVKKYAMALYEAKGKCQDLSDEGKKSYAEIADAAQQAGVSAADFMLSSLNSEEFENAASGVADAIGAVNEALNAQSTGVGITQSAYSELIAVNSAYAGCLESVNGSMQINADKAEEVTKAAARQRVAELELAKAMQQQKYIDNAKNIEAIKDNLDSASPSLANWARENYKNIEAMETENDTIADQCKQYDLLISQIYDVTGAYQGWLNAQNAGQGGDMLKDAKEAAAYIREVLTDNTSDDYMKTGRTNVKYQKALDFVLPDSIDRNDEAAVESYLNELNRFLDKDGTVMVDKVMQMLTDGGIFDPALAKDGIYKMLEGVKISDMMNALNANEEVTQGVLGMLSDYKVYIDVTPAIESFEDLQFYALGAADTLRSMPEYQDLQIDVDVEALKDAEQKTQVLQQTIDAMNGIIAVPGVDASDLQNATLVLQYCQEQINRLNGEPLNFENSAAVLKADEVNGKLKQVEDKAAQTHEIIVDTEQAMNSINALKASLDILPQEKIITIKTQTGAVLSTNPTSAGQNGKAKAAGTDMRLDTAGEPAGGRMLVGEVGREILVNPKTGRWRTVGDNGAEFVNVPRGSIIFDNRQTESLLQQGWVNSRGMSRAGGTARADSSFGRGFSDFGATSNTSWAGSSNLKYGTSVQKAAENTAKAVEKTKQETEEAKDAAQALRKEYDKAKDALDGQKQELEKIKDSLEEQQDIMDGIVDTVTDRIDKEIDRLEHMWDDLKDSLDDHKNDLDDALSAVQKILGDKIEEYEKAQDALDDAYEPRLEALQQEIDALKDKNDAEKEAIDLQKKKAALDAARTNKTMRVYREGQGYVWETDQTAIDEAQQEYSDALHDKTISDLEKQKQALQDELDAEKEKIQKSIEGLQGYSEQWEDVSSAYTDQMNLQKLKEMFGDDAAEKILGMNQSFYEQFLKNYMDTEASIAQVDARIEENQKRIDELEKYKDKWEEVAKAYEKEQNRINTAAQLGADWEQKILGMRIDVVEDFKNRYVDILQQIEEKIKEISALDEQIDGLEVDYKVKLAAVEGEAYAKGTLSAAPGLHKTDELGDEIKIRPCNSGYSILEKGTGVIPAKQTATLWDFANNPESFLSRMIDLKSPDIARNLQTPLRMQTVQVDVGGIVMNGVNDTYSFANELSSQFGNIMTQVLNKR